MAARPTLVVANRRYSSWSLRAWLALVKAGIDFDEVVIPLDLPEHAQRLAEASPTAHLPALHVGGQVIWDSLAIAEWAAEQAPDLLWPADRALRALARSHAATMHSGFQALRREAPMNLGRAPRAAALSDAARRDVGLVEKLWRAHRVEGGPFLFGAWCIADAFWTPVAARLRSYAIEVEPAARAYADALLADKDVEAWRVAALAETYPHPLNGEA